MMSDQPHEPLGWSDADDQQEQLEDLITHLDAPLGAEGHTTAAEQLDGVTLDEALARERRETDLGEPKSVDVVTELDEPDHEPQMVGDDVEQVEGWVPAEEAAMRTVEDPPGATDDASDGYVDDDAAP
jgi:hypothetical protein